MIKANNITKIYGKQKAVNDLNLNIEKGMSYALLGPNGAGKTTTMKILSSLIEANEGEVYIDGEIMNRQNKKIKEELGMVSQHFSLQREMTPVEALTLHGKLHKMPSKEIKAKVDELLTFAQMDKDKGKLIGKLSGGNKRKLMIIRAVMHNPKILFLDEPTVGLDATIRRSIWDLLRRLKNEGLTIILTTHYIEEASVLCDKIGMMSEGKIIAEDSPSGFMTKIEPFTVESFEEGITNYNYFATREEAGTYGASLGVDTLIRETNLEDVYIKYTSKKLQK